MNNDEILTAILTAINDVRKEVVENTRKLGKIEIKICEIEKRIDAMEKRIDSMEEKIKDMDIRIGQNSKDIVSLTRRIEEHEKESRRDRTEILKILHSYEEVTDIQYKENKERIDRLENKLEMISA